MRLWLAHKSEVPLREQIVSQVVLAIVSGGLAAGQRLPSTRELARRTKVHPNTVSAAYRELARAGWVQFRRGSGVYVRSRSRAKALPRSLALDRLIADFFRSAREQSSSLAEIRSRLRHWLALQPPDHFLVIEPDEELRRILVTELEKELPLPVTGAGLEACTKPDALTGAVPLSLPSKLEAVTALLPEGTEVLPLQVRSVPESLAQWIPIPPDSLIAVASRWPDFLKWARTMLLSVGADTDALDFRDARRPRWQEGLRLARAVITDAVTAHSLPRGSRAIVFRMVADSCLRELRDYTKFLAGPLKRP
jgi:GntR family transcriptional regulator